ncbi:MAG: HEPN domain-containing protein [Anaerolineae bacterium]|nr:HEPN domain-containing protein [Anaerolineae bacterium]
MDTPLAATEEALVREKKQKALDGFLERLLADQARESIARIVLFGSLSDGEAREEESDVDVLVFGTDRLRELSESCAAAAFETALEWGESVEPLVYCSDELRFPHSYFLALALRRGKELYRMDETALRRKEAEAALGLAEEYVRAARHALEHSFYRLAVDAAYNAVELCVKGLLLLKLDQIPKAHGGVVQMFGQLYVVSGLVDPQIGRQINVHLELRNKARYDFHARIASEDAQETIESADALIAFLSRELSRE